MIVNFNVFKNYLYAIIQAWQNIFLSVILKVKQVVLK